MTNGDEKCSVVAMRKRAQRAIRLVACERCGATEDLQRHHPDRATPDVAEVLCQNCHTAEHMATGTWGKGPKQPRVCVVCGNTFMHGKRTTKTCGRNCLSELGRRNALRRWRTE